MSTRRFSVTLEPSLQQKLERLQQALEARQPFGFRRRISMDEIIRKCVLRGVDGLLQEVAK